MRKSFIIGLMALTSVSCISPMIAFADNEETLPASTEDTGNTGEDTEYWESDEEDDDEYETYGDGFGPHGEYATYDEYLASISQETLSQEQIDWGYQIIDGKIMSPKDLAGDADENQGDSIIGGVRPSTDTGYVTFIMVMPDGIKDAAYISVLNEDDYKSYSALLYFVNSYKTTISLPSGDYIFDRCGLTTDPDSRYWAETQEFEVKAGLSQIVKIEIKDAYTETTTAPETTLGPYSTTVENSLLETNADGSPVDSSIGSSTGSASGYSYVTSDGQDTTKHFSIANMIFIFICIGVPLVAAYIWWRNNTESKSDDSID